MAIDDRWSELSGEEEDERSEDSVHTECFEEDANGGLGGGGFSSRAKLKMVAKNKSVRADARSGHFDEDQFEEAGQQERPEVEEEEDDDDFGDLPVIGAKPKTAKKKKKEKELLVQARVGLCLKKKGTTVADSEFRCNGSTRGV